MKCFYENGLHFECQRCSYCCGHSPGFVYLSRRDLMTLCEYFGMTVRDFTEEYCRLTGYYEGKTVLALKEKKNYDCILWNEGCSVYKARPVQCSTYPFWDWMVNDKSMWDECSQGCPGMNKGPLHTKAEIDQASALYSSNTPLTKEELEEILSAHE